MISIEVNLSASIQVYTVTIVTIVHYTVLVSLLSLLFLIEQTIFVQWRAALHFHANCQSAVCLGRDSGGAIHQWSWICELSFQIKKPGSSLSSWPWAASAPKLLLKPLQTRRWPEQNQCQLFFVCFVSWLYLPPDSIVWNLGVKLGCPRINKIRCRLSLMTNRTSDPFDENHASIGCKSILPSISRI